MQIQLKRVLFFSAILISSSALSLRSQTFGEITGHVSDPTGAAIAGAKVFLTSVATNALRTTVTTNSGDYTFPAVEPGFYSVRVEQPSFKTATSSNVQVQVQQTVRLDFTLQVGQVNERVEVSASAEMLQAENVALGTVIRGLRNCHSMAAII